MRETNKKAKYHIPSIVVLVISSTLLLIWMISDIIKYQLFNKPIFIGAIAIVWFWVGLICISLILLSKYNKFLKNRIASIITLVLFLLEFIIGISGSFGIGKILVGTGVATFCVFAFSFGIGLLILKKVTTNKSQLSNLKS